MKQNINQLKKEIEECPFTPEAFPSVIEKKPERHCSTCRVNVIKLQTLQQVCEEIKLKLEDYHERLEDKRLPELTQANLSGMILALDELLKKFQGE